MEKRKRRLSDIGKQLRVKVQKQEINDVFELCCDQGNRTADGDILAVTSLNNTKPNVRSNDIERGQEPLLFTKAVARVTTNEQLKKSSVSSVINNRDNKKIGECGRSEGDTKNNTRVFLRDDSGYQSEDLFESPSSSDSEESFQPEQYGHVHDSTGSVLAPFVKFLNPETKEIRSLDSNLGTFVNYNINKDASPRICEDTPVIESDKITEEVFEFDVDESDEIIPNECTDIISKKRPRSVDKRWASSSLGSYIGEHLLKYGTVKRRNSLPDKLRRASSIEPDQKSTIYIPHKNADKPIGDEFGADVWTYQTVQKDGTIYYQHFFVNVKHDGPAAKMKIHDNDEIVLLNTIFVPNFTHTKVLNLFHLVKVDGKTRFELVLRRLEKVGSKKEWEWIDTSAILAPDHRHDVDTYPEVEKPKLKKLKSNEYAVKSFHYYKVPGTQCYLDIEHNAVVASVFTDTDADKTKIICRIDQYKFNKETGKIEFTAALCSEKMSKYIVVGTDRQIKVDDNPMWFEMTTILPNIMFKINGLFLACNTETHRIETHDTEYMFEEVPIKGGIDHPDHAMPMNLAQGNPFDMSPVIAGPPSSTACIKGEYDIYRRRKRKMSTDELQTHGNDPKDARHESESDAMHTDMRLDIPENTLFHGSRSSDILKTPTTPFRSMLTIN
ncbi:uncharacterized protein LOC123554203 isoform X1 [Mercenaria mercenaria]|uniref:uncharacterized protein LOC123554203 isoform X1 n=1 Tax=Mercenaria mercenaria TaxID=6596 RepID=UPI00234F0220|nr:uncharacterized protein LOC123554203 isoform X1 [Mercenaria mercenaria]